MNKKILLSLAVVLLTSISLMAKPFTTTKKANKTTALAWSPTENYAYKPVTAAGIYTPTVTDVLGCSGAISANTTFICYGSSANITASVAGNPNYTFVWSANCGTPALCPTPTFTSSVTTNTTNTNTTGQSISAVSPSATTTYTVTVTNGAGCSSILTQVITANTQVTATVTPANGTFCGSATTTLTVTPAGGNVGNGGAGVTSSYTYSWSSTPTTTPVTGSTTATITVAPTTTTTYSVTVTDKSSGNCTAVASAVMVATKVTATATASPTAICAGSSSTLTVNMSSPGTATPSFNTVWSSSPADANPGSTLSGGATLTVTITPTVVPATSPTTITYTVTVTDVSTGCTGTASVPLVINPLPTASFAASTISLCQNTAGVKFGDAVAANSGGAGWNPGNLAAGVTYTWSTCAGTTPAGANPGIPTANTGTCVYTVTVSNPPGCNATASVTVIINPIPTASAGTNFSICLGQNAPLGGSPTSTGTSPSYAWSANPVAGSGMPGTSTVANPTVVPTATGVFNYTVTVTDANTCLSTSKITVTVNAQPTISLTPTYVLCKGSAQNVVGTYPGAGATPSYTWSGGLGNVANPSIPTTTAGTYAYTVTVTNGGTCSATASITATVVEVKATATITPSAICFGGVATLSVSPTLTPTYASPNFTYNWTVSPNDGSLPVPCTSASPTVSPTAAGVYNYTVTVTEGASGNSCFVVAAPVTLTVNPTPTVTGSVVGMCPSTAYNLGSYLTLQLGGSSTLSQVIWSDGVTNAGLARPYTTPATAGSTTFIVTVLDNLGCQDTALVKTTVVNAIVLTISSTPVSSCVTPDGTATVIASGGDGNYTYKWDNAGTDAKTTGLTKGNHCVTVTDGLGCFAVTCTNVGVATGIQVKFDPASLKNTTCPGGNDGAVCCLVSGAVGTPTYTWSMGTAAVPIVGAGGTGTDCVSGITVPAGTTATITVTVVDGGGCTLSKDTIITSPPNITVSFVNTPPGCNGGTGGSVQANPAGGTPGYTYLWNSGPTTQTINGAAGTYTVTVTDSHLCQTTASTTLTEPPALVVTGTAVNVTCNAACNGAINLTISGGTGTYSTNWSATTNGGYSANTPNISGLCPDTYTAIVSDANFCQTTVSYTITQPSPIATSTFSTNTTCGGSTGTAWVSNPTGGTGTFSFLWNTSPTGTFVPQATQTATGLKSGIYVVTCTDASGCKTAYPVNVQANGAPTVVVTTTCVSSPGGSDGDACVSITGGVPGYTCTWTGINRAGAAVVIPSPNGTCITGLVAGTYTVNVLDGAGCPATGQDSVCQPTQVAVTLSNQRAKCFGDVDVLTATAIPGIPNYTYNWSGTNSGGPIGPIPPFGPTAATTATITPTVSGTYSITITDGLPSTATASTTVTIPTPMVSTILTKQGLTCSYDVVGILKDSVVGGSGIYSFLWKGGTLPGAGSTSQQITNLGPGTYNVTITDATNPTCFITDSKTLTPNGALTITTVTYAPSCPGYTNGAIDLTVSRLAPVTGPTTGVCTIASTTYAYTQGVLQHITPMPTGAYVVSCTDAVGCTTTANFSVLNVKVAISIPKQTGTITCFKGSNGSLSVGPVTGGNGAPYTFTWSGSSVGAAAGTTTTSTYTGVKAGTYLCVVSDASGCTNTVSFSITQPPGITATITGTNVDCNGNSTGQVKVVAAGGNGAPYTYTISSPPGGSNTTGIFPGLPANLAPGGTPYTVSVTDNQGCNLSTGPVAAPVVCAVTTTITEPVALAFSAPTITNEPCKGDNKGKIVVAISNGTPSYSYTPSAGGGAVGSVLSSGGTFTLFPLTAGTYTVTVTDKNGCTAVSPIYTITEPTQLTTTLSVTASVTCNGGNNGKISAVSNTGTPPYKYDFPSRPSQSGIAANVTVTFTGLNVAGNPYVVTITDANGCQTTATINMVQPPPLTASIVVANTKNVTCKGGNDGYATAQGGGGSLAYNYTWGPGALAGGTTSNLGPVSAGTYFCTVSDQQDVACIAVTQVIISEPTAITISNTGVVAVPDTICFDQTGAAFSILTVTPIGGTGTYDKFVWTDPSGTPTTVNTPGGPTGSFSVSPTAVGINTYTVIAYDNSINNTTGLQSTCASNQGSVVVIVRPHLQVKANNRISASNLNGSCSGDGVTIWAYNAQGGRSINAAGQLDYQYTWSSNPPDATLPGTVSTPTITVNPILPPGTQGPVLYTYTVTLTDNCTNQNPTDNNNVATTTFLVYPLPTSTFTPDKPEGCDGAVITFDGHTNIAQNGSGATTYSWYVDDVLQPGSPVTPITGDQSPTLTRSFNYVGANDKNSNGTVQYSVKLRATTLPADGNPCTHEDSTTVTIYQYPSPSIAPDDEYKDVFDILPFARVHAEHADNYSSYDEYHWNMGDPTSVDSSQTTPNASHVYPGVGVYNVKLRVKRYYMLNGVRYSCDGTANMDLIVKPKTQIWIPDAFTPNGDGNNDFFEPKGINIASYQIYIYDRWGGLVYASGDRSKPWDGSAVNGAPAVQDVYIYKILITDARGTKLEPFVGKVTLIK